MASLVHRRFINGVTHSDTGEGAVREGNCQVLGVKCGWHKFWESDIAGSGKIPFTE